MNTDIAKILSWLFFIFFGIVIIVLGIHAYESNDLLLMVFLWISVCVELSFEIFICYITDNIQLIQGETRKLRREKKKLLKLKAQKNYLETKKERQEETEKLQCKIHNLKMEIEGKLTVCKECGKRIYRNSCFCPKCGVKIK